MKANILIVTYLLCVTDLAIAGYSIKTDDIELNTYGSLDSKIGGNFKYKITETTKIISEASANQVNDSYGGNLNSFYLSHSINNNFKLKIGKLKLKDNLDYRYSIDEGKNLKEIYSENKLNDYDGISTQNSIKLWNSGLKLNVQNLYGQSIPKSFGLSDNTLPIISYKKILGTNTSLISPYGKTRISYIEIEPSIKDSSMLVSKGELTSVGHKIKSPYFSNQSEYVKRTFKGINKTVDSYYTSFSYPSHMVKPYTTFAQSIERNGGTQKSMAYGLNYSFMNNFKIKGEYKKIYSDANYSGNFVDTGIGVFNSNVNDDEIVSIGVNLYY